MKTLPPGAVIGILGGGQLGRMTALAAAALGYRSHIFCQQADEPAAQVTSRVTLGAFDDRDALRTFAAACDVVTLEWENVPLAALDAVSAVTPVHPGAAVLAVAQDRLAEKQFARNLGFATADFAAIDSAADLRAALAGPAILKTRRMGYDGKGQLRLAPGADADAAWRDLGGAPAILESMVDFACEISVIAARRADGQCAVFPPARNSHKNGILATSQVPCGLPAAVVAEADHIARRMADALGVVGLLAVELFVLRAPCVSGNLLAINEIAPRPHNSGHWTMDACATSQFEQLVRAVCGLPLGDTTACGGAVMHNLIGADAHDWQQWLATPHAHLHLYGKAEARDGRKMGHVTLCESEA